MNYLIDSHVLLWALADTKRLSAKVLDILSDLDNQIYLSSASLWELSMKAALNKLPKWKIIQNNIKSLQLKELPIKWKHCQNLNELPTHHKDPFDRMLISQAQIEDLAIISYDKIFQKYSVRVIT